MRPTVVPIPLGCCPHEPRCLLCPPADPPGPDTVAALVACYADEHPGQPLEVRFFGGAPPDDALIEAIGGAPFAARVRPDLLTRADAARLAARGCVAIELDALTFDDAALREARRPYRARRVEEISRALPALGLRVGGTLAPGLPRTTHDTSVRDAGIAADLWSFVRIHPVLVLDRSALRDLHETGRYAPLELAEAVTVCHAMLDRLESAGVEVIRVGLQPGPDGFGRATAGPRHPSLRELVEARRAFEALRARLVGAPRGAAITVRCARADVSRARGPYNRHVRALRAELGLAELDVVGDPAIERGRYEIDVGAGVAGR